LLEDQKITGRVRPLQAGQPLQLAIHRFQALLVQPFNYANKTTLHRSAIYTDAVRFAAEDVGSDSYRELDLDAARQSREEDMRAAQVAQAMGADIFITARRYVFESSALRQSRVAS